MAVNQTSDTIDVRQVAASLWRERRWIVSGTAAGLLLAGLLLVVIPARYESTATVLLRNVSAGGAGLEGQGSGSSRGGALSLGGLAEIFSMESGFETELEILTSRSVLRAVVDSLGLQAQVKAPSGRAANSLFASASYAPDLPEGVYRFRRHGDRFEVSGPGVSGHAIPGAPFSLPGARVTLRSDDLPDRFDVRLVDAADAVEGVARRLKAKQAGGSIAEIVYRAPDPATAAAVPNALVAQYLKRRQTTDRGLNQHRYEFIATQIDSLSGELARAERALRSHQESSGILDSEVQRRAEIERALALRSQMETLDVELRALNQVVDASASGRLSARELGAYPSLIHNPAVNHLLGRLSDLEARRTDLLERRTARDPDVEALDRGIRQAEEQLITHSRAYREGLLRQQAEVGREFGRYQNTLGALPAQVEETLRREREVERLSETLFALQAQLVQARLGAITEGGDVRQVDLAEAPKRVHFPRPIMFLPIGLICGLILGTAGALGSAYLRETIRYPHEVELALGIPTIPYRANLPLLLGSAQPGSGVLVVPVGARVDSGEVACRIASTAALQGKHVVLADFLASPVECQAPPFALLSDGSTEEITAGDGGSERSLVAREDAASVGQYFLYRGSGNGARLAGARSALEALQRRVDLVIAALPQLDDPVTTALLSPEQFVVLVARAGYVSRTELHDVVGSLQRVGFSVASVVLHDAAGARHN